MKVKIKKNQKVKVISGSYKGKEGVVINSSIINRTAIVEGINLKKKTNKQNREDSQKIDNFTYIAHPISWSKLKPVE